MVFQMLFKGEEYTYNRYTLRLEDSVAEYVKRTAEERGITQTDFIKAILGEYKEVHAHGKRK